MKTAAIYVVGILAAIVALEGLAVGAGRHADAASPKAASWSLMQGATAVEMAEVNFMGITGETATETGKTVSQVAENKASK